MNTLRKISIGVIIAAAGLFMSQNFGEKGMLKDCLSVENSREQAISACTVLLDRDGLSKETRGTALFRRAYVAMYHDNASSEADYLELLELWPEDTWALNNLGLVYLDQNAPEKALPYLDRALEIDPTAHHRRANRTKAYHMLKRYEDVIADANIVLKADPENVNVIWYRAESHKALDQDDQAFADFSDVARLAPDFAPAHHDRAWIYHSHMKQPRHAEVGLKHTLSLTPKSYRALADMGYVQLRLDRFQTAKEYFEAALSVQSDFRRAQRGLKQATDKIKELRERSARLSTPLGREEMAKLRGFGQLYAMSYLEIGNTARALTELEILHKKYPEDFKIHYAKARVLQEINDHKAAVSEFRKYLPLLDARGSTEDKIPETITQLHDSIGMSEHRSGNSEQALSAWRKSFETGTDEHVSLWQLRLSYAGYFKGHIDGKPSEKLWDALAECAADPNCVVSD